MVCALSNIACVQTCSGPDPEQNIREAEALIRSAHAANASLIALPESVDLLAPDAQSYLDYAPPAEEHAALHRFRQLAKELGIWLLVGSVTVKNESGRLSNRSCLYAPSGDVAASYDKIHLFDTGVIGASASRESAMYDAGDRAVLVDTPSGILGLTICYDLRFPQLFRVLAKAGAELLAVPSAFLQITGEAHWHVLLRARAIETGCYVFAPAQCGNNYVGRESFGHSLIVDPWGRIVANGGTSPGFITAELDMNLVHQTRERIQSLRHDRSFASPAQELQRYV